MPLVRHFIPIRVWLELRPLLVLAIYDAFTTFPQEVQCAWKRKKNAVTILYLCIRYGIILDVFIQVLDEFYPFRTIAVSISIRCVCPNYVLFHLGVCIHMFVTMKER